MKFKGFEIVEFLTGEKAGFYSIRFEGENESEAEKFFEILDAEDEEIAGNFLSKIEYQANIRGCIDGFFYYERDYNIYKLKDGKWRLYCIKFGKVAVILGGGGYKNVRKTQDSATLEKNVNMLQIINNMINKRISEGDLHVTDNGIEGNLKFEIE